MPSLHNTSMYGYAVHGKRFVLKWKANVPQAIVSGTTEIVGAGFPLATNDGTRGRQTFGAACHRLDRDNLRAVTHAPIGGNRVN